MRDGPCRAVRDSRCCDDPWLCLCTLTIPGPLCLCAGVAVDGQEEAYEAFEPIALRQNEGKPVKSFDTFDLALDEFYAKARQ
jgi:hypothetical protein